MATIDLGKIKQVWRGTYNNSTAYVVDDLVAYTDSGILSTYICVANSTGNAPSSSGTAHASWNYVAKGVVDPIPSQSGNSGKVLKTNGSVLSFGSGSLVERVYHWWDDTQASANIVSGSSSSTGVNVFTYTITAKTANPIYRLDWSFFWGLNNTSGDANEIMAIAGIFKHASNTGLANLAYGFGFKGGSRANGTFRTQTNDYCVHDSDAGVPGTDANWNAMMVSNSCFGNTTTADQGTIGKCGDDSTQSVAAGDTLYLRGWVGSGNDGTYGRTQNQTNHMTKAQIILTEFNSSGQ